MAPRNGPAPRPRVPLSRERVLQAAVQLADAAGLEAVTMRRLADELGAEAMSLYHHVGGKDEVLDGAMEVVMAQVNEAVAAAGPADGADSWQAGVRARILAARTVLLRHPWAPGLLESRAAASLGVLAYHDGLVGQLRAGGFSYDQIHHALHALGSRALGFSQELVADSGPEPPQLPDELARQFPHLAGMLAQVAHDDPATTVGWCDDQAEFEFGLDLILDGLDRARMDMQIELP